MEKLKKRFKNSLNYIEIYEEKSFEKFFPELKKFCEEKLKGEDYYFGQCLQWRKNDNHFHVLYNFNNNEDRSAIFVFGDDGKLVESDLNDID